MKFIFKNDVWQDSYRQGFLDNMISSLAVLFELFPLPPANKEEEWRRRRYRDAISHSSILFCVAFMAVAALIYFGVSK